MSRVLALSARVKWRDTLSLTVSLLIPLLFVLHSPIPIFVLIWILMHGLGNNLNWWLLNVLSTRVRCSFCGWNLFDRLVYFLVYLLPGSSIYIFWGLFVKETSTYYVIMRGWGWAKSLCMIMWGWVRVLNPSENDYIICGCSLIIPHYI